MTRPTYTEEEIDAVVDHFDLGFMRNRLKASNADVNELMGGVAAAVVVLSIRLRKFARSVLNALQGRQS